MECKVVRFFFPASSFSFSRRFGLLFNIDAGNSNNVHQHHHFPSTLKNIAIILTQSFRTSYLFFFLLSISDLSVIICTYFLISNEILLCPVKFLRTKDY